MALGSCPYCSPLWNLLLVISNNNELVGDPPGAPIQSSNSPVPTSCAPTPTPTPALATPPTNNKVFNKFMEAYLVAQVQRPASTPAPIQLEPRRQPFKGYFPELYFGNLYIAYYYFC